MTSSLIMIIWPFFLKKGRMISLGRAHGFLLLLQLQYCPVPLLNKFLSRGVNFSNSYLFRKICHTSSGYRLGSQRLTYSRDLQLVRKQLKAIHVDPKQYGLHSVRSGGGGGGGKG